MRSQQATQMVAIPNSLAEIVDYVTPLCQPVFDQSILGWVLGVPLSFFYSPSET